MVFLCFQTKWKDLTPSKKCRPPPLPIPFPPPVPGDTRCHQHSCNRRPFLPRDGTSETNRWWSYFSASGSGRKSRVSSHPDKLKPVFLLRRLCLNISCCLLPIFFVAVKTQKSFALARYDSLLEESNYILPKAKVLFSGDWFVDLYVGY